MGVDLAARDRNLCKRQTSSLLVMPGLVPGIHVRQLPPASQNGVRLERLVPRHDVDGRDKPGHDYK
jgi:hypothetical protein